jgi:hypothetical protein
LKAQNGKQRLAAAAALLLTWSLSTWSEARAAEPSALAASDTGVSNTAASDTAAGDKAPALATVPEPPTEKHMLSPERIFVPWSKQAIRWFGALEFDTGFLYVRPRFSFGYGRPHARWVGVDLNPIFSEEGVAGYAGLRLASSLLSLRAGARYWYTFQRSFLEQRDHYTVEDIELRTGPRSSFLTWEAELALSLPVGPGSILAEAAGSYVTGVADDFFVYEETLRVVVDPPWVVRARPGYLLAYRSIQIGPVFELVAVPRRDALVLRAGGLVRITLSGDLEARGTFVPAVATPDALGARGGDAFLLGIRYRWATQ